MAVNYHGTYAAIRAFVPVLEANGGRIVNVLSLLSLASTPPMTGYSASKAALAAWSDTLYLEERGHGVHVGAPPTTRHSTRSRSRCRSHARSPYAGRGPCPARRTRPTR